MGDMADYAEDIYHGKVRKAIEQQHEQNKERKTMTEKDVSIILQALMKPVIAGYINQESWNDEDEEEIHNRTQIALNVYKRHYTRITKKMKG